MNSKQDVRLGKEVSRRIEIGWDETLKAFFACYEDAEIDPVAPGLMVAQYVGTISHLDDVSRVLSDWGTMSSDEQQRMMRDCASVQLPEPLFWVLT